ncbi:MAG: ATP-binding protein [Firmicutes bacterium]|nr:ATP-binding protein [Bacillota bacterium]
MFADGKKTKRQPERPEQPKPEQSSGRMRETDESTQLLLDAAPICCKLWSRDYKILDCNAECVRVFGVASKQEFCERFFEFSPQFQPCGRLSKVMAVESITQALVEGNLRFEWMHQKLNGESLPSEITMVRVQHRGEPAVAAFIRDLTRQRQREAEKEADHRAQELQLTKMNLMVKAAKIGLWDMDVQPDDPLNPTNHFTWSDEFRHLLGYSGTSDFPDILSSWSDLIHPDDKEEVLAAFEKHLLDKTGKTPYDIKYRMMKKTGEYAYFHDFGATLRDESGNPGRVAGALIDITETKQLLLNLEHESSTLQTMFDSVSDLIFCKDSDLNYTRCNQSLLRYFNLKEEDLIGKDDENGLRVPKVTAEKFRATDLAVMRERRALMYDEYIPGADGVQRLFETNKVPLFSGGRVIGIMGIARDITKRKALEDAAKATNRAKSAFIANMSHEMRTPLNSIIGFSELALDDKIEPRTAEYLNLILDSSKWLLELINDILDLSKIESGNMEIENTPFDLHELFVACKTLIAPRATEKNIDLFFYAEPFIGKKLVGDPVRLRQVLINLLSNAVKFTVSGTVKLAAVMVHNPGERQDKDSRTLRFEVRDTGIGMTEKQLKKIFNPFTQADAGTTRKYGGTGLGLTITKNIVELMGGSLVIESELGVGTKASFTITFNVTSRSAEILQNLNVAADMPKPLFKGDVLVCEDNRMNRRVISEHLNRVGLHTVMAQTGRDGIEIVRGRIKQGKKPFDLILMDIHMPILDGIEATPRIIGLGVKTPIIAMTANVMKDDIEMYKKIGMVDHLGKPFTSQELWRLLLKYLKPVGAAPEQEDGNADNQLSRQLRSDFVNRNRHMFEEIMAALNTPDITLAHRLAHTLKSSAGLIGKFDLYKAAAAVEFALKSGKRLTSAAQEALLKTELARVLEDLASYAEAPVNPPTPQIKYDPESVHTLFERLRPLLKSGNLECLKFADELRAVPGCEKLIEQIEDFDFCTAAETLQQLKDSNSLFI